MSTLAVDNITDEVGTGAPAFPNGMSVTGATLTDPEITGGIFLGGTSSANKLDDYEEGTWTPVFDNQFTEGAFNSVTGFINTDGEYTKVGRLVTAIAEFKTTGSSATVSAGDNFTIDYGSLPFFPVIGQNDLRDAGGTLQGYNSVGSGKNLGGSTIFVTNVGGIVCQVGWVTNTAEAASNYRYTVSLQYYTNS